MKKLLVLFLLLTSLIGCGTKTKTTICVFTDEYGTVTYTFTAKENEIVKEGFEDKYNRSYYSPDVTSEDIIQNLEGNKAKYEGVAGASYVYSFNEDTGDIVATRTLDFTKTTVEELKAAGALGPGANSNYTNLEIAIKEVEDLGYVCDAK